MFHSPPSSPEPRPSRRPFLILAAAILASTALAASAPGVFWGAFAAPLLLAGSLVGAEIGERRLAGKAAMPSRGVLWMAGAILLAGGLVAASDPGQIAVMIPILGSCATFPLLEGPSGRKSCGS